MVRASWSLLLLLMACTSTERPPEPEPVPIPGDEPAEPIPGDEPAEPTAETTAETIERAPVVQELAWRWKARFLDETRPWASMPTSIRNGPTQIRAFNMSSSGVDVVKYAQGHVPWSTSVGEYPHDAAALVLAGDVLVAFFHSIEPGASVTRLDAQTGTPVWTQRLQGLGPDHDSNRNAVQIEVAAGKVFVFGREVPGAYVEVLDLQDGHQLQHSLVEPALVGLSWREVRPPPAGSTGFSLPPSWSITGNDPPLLRHEAGVGPGTSILLPHGFGKCDTGAGMVHDGVLYLVHACSITSGARLYAVGVGETAWRWQADLYAVGPIAHSAYSNRVDLEWKDGRVVVYGDEAMGRYTEAVDPRTGVTLVNKRWPLR